VRRGSRCAAQQALRARNALRAIGMRFARRPFGRIRRSSAACDHALRVNVSIDSMRAGPCVLFATVLVPEHRRFALPSGKSTKRCCIDCRVKREGTD